MTTDDWLCRLYHFLLEKGLTWSDIYLLDDASKYPPTPPNITYALQGLGHCSHVILLLIYFQLNDSSPIGSYEDMLELFQRSMNPEVKPPKAIYQKPVVHNFRPSQ